MPNTRLKRYNGNSWEEVEVQTDWGQVLNKPTTFTPTSHTHGNILNTGSITSATITPADQDRILVADASNSGKIERGIIIGTGTTTFLRNDGTWAVPSGEDTNNYLTGVSGSGNGTITFTRQGLTNLTFNAAHTHAISDVTNLQTTLDAKIPLTQKGAANGVATLDAAGFIPSSQLGAWIRGGIRLSGTLNNSTNNSMYIIMYGITQGWAYGGSAGVSSSEPEEEIGRGWVASEDMTLIAGSTLSGHAFTIKAPGDEGDNTVPIDLEAGDMLLLTGYSYPSSVHTWEFTIINNSDARFANYLPLTGGTMTGTLTAPTIKLTNDATDTVNHRITVWDSGSGVSYGTMLWNTSGVNGEWATMIYGPNEPNRRISFGKVNSTTFSTHSNVTEGAYFDLDNWNLILKTGNLGIGTESPGRKLHLVGDAEIDGSIYLNDTNTRLGEGTLDSLRVQTSTGYVDIGSMNGAWLHIQTDRPRFYFDKPVSINGNLQDYSTGSTYWHAGNDGSGSGLDADLLDNKHASDFLLTTARGAANGVAPLDGNGQVPASYLSISGFYYRGSLGGNTDLFDLVDGTGVKSGDFWTATTTLNITWTNDPDNSYVVDPGDEGDVTSPITIEAGDMLVVSRVEVISQSETNWYFSIINNTDPRFANYLPLSGGTMTNNILFANNSDLGIRNAAGTALFYVDDSYGNTFIKSDNGVYFQGNNFYYRNQSIDYKFFINGDSGNVGIGTTSPASYGSGYKTLAISGAGNGGVIDFLNGSTRLGTIYADTTNYTLSAITSLPMRFLTNDTERMRITGDGNVGIGTTSPAVKFHIQSGHNDTLFRLFADNGGYPQSSLHLWASEPGISFDGAGIGSNVNNSIYYGKLTNTIPSSAIRFYQGDFIFLTSPATSEGYSERFRITQTGNVGVGTTSPSTKLEVAGGQFKIYEGGNLALKTYSADAGGFIVSYQSDSGSPYTKTLDIVANGDSTVPADMRFLTKADGSSNPTERMRITSGGNVGIGTTAPGAKLEVSGDLLVKNPSVYGRINGYDQYHSILMRGNISGTTTQTVVPGDSMTFAEYGGTFRFKTLTPSENTDLMTLTPTGLGIGTTAPQYKLHVVGTMNTTDRYYQNEWIQFNNYTGLYSPNNGAHFYPNTGSYGAWRVAGSRNGYNGIEFDGSAGNVSLMVQTGSNTTGFHNNSYGWQFYWESGSLNVAKNAYGGGTIATVLDSSNVGTYAFPKSGSWLGDLGSNGFTREHGVTMTGGSEFVVLSKSGQGYTLVDGSYFSYEGGGFFTSSTSAYGDLTGFKSTAANTVNFTQFDGGSAVVQVNGNTVWHKGNLTFTLVGTTLTITAD